MSYCRWSCDDYRSEVYCYESDGGGFVTHVAGNRVVFAEPLPAPVPFDLEHQDEWLPRPPRAIDLLRAEQADLSAQQRISQIRDELWYLRGGPKNNGRFGYMCGHQFMIGLNHWPMTKAARVRSARLMVRRERGSS